MNDPDAIAQKLRDLPTDVAPPYDWAEFQQRWQTSRGTGPKQQLHVREGTERGARAVRGAHVMRARGRTAFAAAFALVMASAAVWVRFSTDHRTTTPIAYTEEHTLSHARHDFMNAQDAERWLATLPAEPAIVRVDTRFAVADLEDRIALLDDALTTAQLDDEPAAHIRAMRRERAQLINSLAQVRYAETLAAELP